MFLNEFRSIVNVTRTYRVTHKGQLDGDYVHMMDQEDWVHVMNQIGLRVIQIRLIELDSI